VKANKKVSAIEIEQTERKMVSRPNEKKEKKIKTKEKDEKN
jgi:hypothetical protein